MSFFKKIFLAYLLLIIWNGPAIACTYKGIEDYDAIFEAMPIKTETDSFKNWFFSSSTNPDSITKFKIYKKYVGELDKFINIKHYSNTKDPSGMVFTKGRKYIVFANKDSSNEFVLTPCSPTFQQKSRDIDKEMLEDVAKSSEFRKNLLRDFSRIEFRLEKIYTEEYTALKELYEKYPSPNEATRHKEKYRNTTICKGIFGSDHDTPRFLREFPLPVPRGFYIRNRQNLLKYGVILFNLGEYKASLRAFCLGSEEIEGTDFWQKISMYKLGVYQKDLSKYIDGKRTILTNIKLDGIDVGSIDFEGTQFFDSSLRQANLSGSKFNNTKIEYVDAKGAKLVGADFTNSVISGDFTDANLSRSILKNVKMHHLKLNNADLSKANIKGANFSKLGLDDLKGINLQDAIFDESTFWPVGFLPEKHGAIIVQGSSLYLRLPLNNDIHLGDEKAPGILNLEKEGEYLVDGVHIKNYRRIISTNGKINLLKVFTSSIPGQTNALKNVGEQSPFKKLMLFGDPNKDMVLLDGCFKWMFDEEISSAKAFYKPAGSEKHITVNFKQYIVSPESGQQIEVNIQNGLIVSFSKDCFSPDVKEYEVLPREGESKKDHWILPFSESKKERLFLLGQKVLALEKYWAQSSPPNLINLPAVAKGTAACPAGKAVFDKSGTYNVKIPEGCKTLYVKAWGAGGGNSHGGPGGFTAGVIEIPKNSIISTIVGGGGKDPKGHKGGEGGFNGGGDGGSAHGAGRAGSKGNRGGGGGGGRTELIVNGNPVVIAGGGGGSGRGPRGYPGGGRNIKNLISPYAHLSGINHISPQNLSGSDGKSGVAKPKKKHKSCYSAMDGGSKIGGTGGGAENIDCVVAGGAGGGSGYGAGAGGSRNSPGYGGGGGGLAPKYGITVWGRSGGHLPANVDDLYHAGLSGREGSDGLIAITWPAPDPEDFYKSIVTHVSDKSAFVKDDGGADHMRKLYKKLYEDQRRDYKRLGLGKRSLKKQTPQAYKINDTLNISVYEQWSLEVHPEEQSFYQIAINLMKEKKFPTEFLVSGKSYGLDKNDFVLRQLQKGFVGQTLPEENKKIRMLQLGLDNNSRILKQGWGAYKADLNCSRIPAKRSIYAHKKQDYFGGLGVAIKSIHNELKIVRVIPGLTAHKASLKPGDTIVSIDGLNTKDTSLDELVNVLRGPVGSSVIIEVKGGNQSDELQKIYLKRTYMGFENKKEPELLFKTYEKPHLENQNYFIFGKGIKPENMNWENNKKLVNNETNDSIEFISKPCAHFIFIESGQFETNNIENLEETEITNENKVNIYNSYADIPRVLINNYLRNNVTKENYLRKSENVFKRFSESQGYINLDFVRKKQDVKIKQEIKKQRSQILNYDDNLDGIVSFNEIEKQLEDKSGNLSPERYKRLVDDTLGQYQALDVNQDKLISHDEMINLDKAKRQRIEDSVLNQYQPYLELDPNNDGKIVFEEYAKKLLKAFKTLDLNDDDVIDIDEISQYKAGLVSQSFSADKTKELKSDVH